MDPLPTESEHVAIRCPGCGQRFTVGTELVGRIVECGSCDRRFRVEEGVMLRHRKFYPGEHRDPSLEHFGRVPMRSAVPPSFEPAHYQAEAPPVSAIEPTSPLRIVFGAAGVLLAVMVALVLIFGGGSGGVLDGTSGGKRLILAGFSAAVTFVLLWRANPRSRLKGALVGAGMGLGLLVLPFVFKEGSHEPVAELAGVLSANAESSEGVGLSAAAAGDRFAALKEEIGYRPLERALSEYGPDGVTGGRTVVGVWLRDLRDYNKRQVLDYLRRKTGAADSSWMYERERGDYLLVLRDVQPGLGRISKLCERFGSPRRTIEELGIVEVLVNNDSFIQGDLSKLQDQEDPAFYHLNLRELQSIDLERARAAVIRLAGAEPRVRRTDIVRRMIELLDEGDTDMKREIASALAVWASDGDGAVGALRNTARELLARDGTVPGPLMALLVREKDPDSLPILHELWSSDAKAWETLYGDFGSAAEDRLIEALADTSTTLRQSAVRLLGRIGTPKSLPELEKLRNGATSELSVLIEQAESAIRARGS